MRSAWMLGFLCLALSSMLSAAEPKAARTVYRCDIEGVPTFTDRPCGQSATSQALDPLVVNTYEPPPIASFERAASANRPKRTDDTSKARERQKEDCAKLDERLDTIRSKLRAGYTAKKGERLKEQQKSLKDRQRTMQCNQTLR